MKTVGVFVVGSLGCAVALACGSWALELADRGVASVDEAVALGATGLAAALGAWYGLTAVAVVLLRLAGASRNRGVVALRQVAGTLGAPVLRRAVAAGAGAGLLLGMSPAVADSGAVPGSVPLAVESAEPEVPADLRPGFLPGPDPVPESAGATTGIEEGAAESNPPVPEATSGRGADPGTGPPAPDPTSAGGAVEATPAPPAPDSAPAVAHSSTGPRGAGPGATAVGLTATASTEFVAERYVVRPGDSLWSIAAEHLEGTPSNAEIAAAWPRWHTANRAVIGADPNLIHPGQELMAPDQEDAS